MPGHVKCYKFTYKIKIKEGSHFRKGLLSSLDIDREVLENGLMRQTQGKIVL